MNKVLIIGSGSDSSVTPFDGVITYSSNSSISRIDKVYDCQIVHVASINMFDKNIIGKTPHLIARNSTLKNRAPRELFLYPTFNLYDKNNLDFSQLDYKPKFNYSMGRLKFWKLIYNAAGIRPWLYALRYDEGYVKNLARLFLHIFGRSIGPRFLPSTGVFSLLLAISRHGDRITYYLDGIRSDSTNIGESYYNGIVMKVGGHEPFDDIIMRAIKRKYKLIFQQETLQDTE